MKKTFLSVASVLAVAAGATANAVPAHAATLWTVGPGQSKSAAPAGCFKLRPHRRAGRSKFLCKLGRPSSPQASSRAVLNIRPRYTHHLNIQLYRTLVAF